jgi:hypothetical protein
MLTNVSASDFATGNFPNPGAIATAGQPAGRVNLRVHRMVSDSLASM